jgi:glycosyltransferase involved in cell wall biosynthesis
MTAHPLPDDIEPTAPGSPAAPAATDAVMRVLLVDSSDRGGIARYTGALRSAHEAEHVEVALAAPPASATLRGLRWGPDVAQMGRGAALHHAPGRARPVRARLGPGRGAVWPRRGPRADRGGPRPRRPGLGAHLAAARAAADQARRWRAADALIMHSEERRGLVEASAPGVPVSVVPVNVFDYGSTVSGAQARKELGLDDVPTALLLGQIRPYKGVGLLAQAWPEVAARPPGAKLLVVGESYHSADLDRLAGCAGEIRSGYVTEGDPGRWSAAADVLVLPYSVGSHSGVLHLGLAAGTPVVLAPAGGGGVPDRSGRGGGPRSPGPGRRPGPGPERPAAAPSRAVLGSGHGARDPRRLWRGPGRPRADRGMSGVTVGGIRTTGPDQDTAGGQASTGRRRSGRN